MNYRNILAFILSSVLLLLTACSKDDDNYNDSNKYLPTMVVSDGEISTTIIKYNYDQKNRLIKVVKTESYSQNNILNEISLSIDYDQFDKISRLTKNATTSGNPNSKVEIVNDTMRFTYSGTDIISDNSVSQINSHGQLLNHRTLNQDGTKTLVAKFCEYDSLGNLSKYTYTEPEQSVINVFEYDYDHKNGIFRDVNTPQWFFIVFLEENLNLINNNTLQTLHPEKGETSITTRTYEYNGDGYPVSERVYYAGYSLTVDVDPIKIEYKLVN